MTSSASGRGRRFPPIADVHIRRSQRFGFWGCLPNPSLSGGCVHHSGHHLGRPSARVQRLERVACEHVRARQMEAGTRARTTLPPSAVEDAARVITTPRCDPWRWSRTVDGTPTGAFRIDQPSSSRRRSSRPEGSALDGKHHDEDEWGPIRSGASGQAPGRCAPLRQTSAFTKEPRRGNLSSGRGSLPASTSVNVSQVYLLVAPDACDHRGAQPSVGQVAWPSWRRCRRRRQWGPRWRTFSFTADTPLRRRLDLPLRVGQPCGSVWPPTSTVAPARLT